MAVPSSVIAGLAKPREEDRPLRCFPVGLRYARKAGRRALLPGGGTCFLEGPEGLRFLIRSRLFTDDEYAALQPAGRV